MLRWFRARRRALFVFATTFAVLAMLAGKTLLRPSDNAHFVYMASGWLEGRLHHEGKPPGYCDARLRRAGKCRNHRFDDWAVLTTLELPEGEAVRAYPCRTEACKEARKTEGLETWYVTGAAGPPILVALRDA